MLTAAALTYATVQLRRGNRDNFQRALRYRVLFQTVTVVAAAASLYYLRAPKSRVPEEPGPDGKPQKLLPWNPEKIEQRERDNEKEWRSRFHDAQSRNDREEAAVERMIREAIAQREQEEKMKAKEAEKVKTTAADTEEHNAQSGPLHLSSDKMERAKSILARVGQDKRQWSFHVNGSNSASS